MTTPPPGSGPDLSLRIDAARDHLDRILGFFSRVDGKASVILAIDTSMIALLATRSLSQLNMGFIWIPTAIAALCLAVSLWYVYREGFPSLQGGEDSILYFREIDKRTEAKFIEAWKHETDERYLNDLLGQIWRNSKILTAKFDYVRLALIWLSVAILPWAISSALLSL